MSTRAIKRSRVGGDVVLGEFMTEAMQRLMPTGTPVESHSLNDKIGAMILARSMYHLSKDHEEDQELRILLALFCGVVGPSTGLREPKQSYMELLQQLN